MDTENMSAGASLDTPVVHSSDACENEDETWACGLNLSRIDILQILDTAGGTDKEVSVSGGSEEVIDRPIIIKEGRTMEVPKELYDRTLDPAKREIRLLRIHPLEKDRENIYVVDITMIVIPLDEAVNYHALSYTWGDATWSYEETFAQVFVNDRLAHVTFNLLDALTNMASLGLTDMIWVDALCINQQDNEEKSHQVRMMGEIYKRATMTRVWLGSSYDDRHLAMDLMTEAQEYVDQHHGGWPFRPKKESKYPLVDWFAEKYADETYLHHWKAFASLCQDPYWTRSWIIQEIVLSEHALLMCGQLSVHIHIFFAILREIGAMVVASREVISLDKLVPLYEIRYPGKLRSAWVSNRTERRQLYLFESLMRFRTNYSSVKRDRFYSVLGISKAYPGPPLPIDYDCDTAEVYIQAAKYIVAGTGNLNLLCECQPRSRDQVDKELEHLPSWVPDWGDRNCLWDSPDHRNPANAGGKHSDEVFYKEDVGGKILATSAIIIGPVQDLVEMESIDGPHCANAQLRKAIDFVVPDGLARIDNSSSALSSDAGLKDDLERFRRLIAYRRKYNRIREDWWPLEELALMAGQEERILRVDPSTRKRSTWYLHSALQERKILKVKLRSEMAKAHQDHTFGIASIMAKVDDVVAVVIGCVFPLILRRTEKLAHYTIVGDAVVDGLMSGEALECEKKIIYLH